MGSDIDPVGKAGHDCNASFAEILGQFLNEALSGGRGVSGTDDSNHLSVQ